MIHRYKPEDRVFLNMCKVGGVDSKTGTIIKEYVIYKHKDSIYLIDWDEGVRSCASGYWLRPFIKSCNSIW